MATKQRKNLFIGVAAALAVASGIVAVNNTSTEQAAVVPAKKYHPIKNMLGINAHEWDLISHPQQAGKEKRTADLQNAIISTGFTGIRIYADADVNKDAENKTWKFNPDGRGYEKDDAIVSLKKRNPALKVLLCYQNMPANYRKQWEAAGKRSTQYRLPGSDPLKAETWGQVASDMGVITARGGSNPNVPDYPLFQSPNAWEPKQAMLKGAKLYDEVEPGNEWDNGWSNVNATSGKMEGNVPALTGSQYAVPWKACYEKVKAVDPNMAMSTTGVMTEDTKVQLDVIAWEKANNSGKPVFDKYQFHCYPWGWAKDIASGLPPDYNLIPAAERQTSIPDPRPEIVGEWGYDLHPDSDIGVRPPAGYSGEEYRGHLIARSIIGFAAVGIERAYYYRIYQDYGLQNDNNATIFETSSLFIKDEKDNISRRFSGDVFKQLKAFGDFVYDSALVKNDQQKVYRFKSGGKYLYVAWAVESVDLVTVPNGQWSTNRAKITERKMNYTLPAGTRYELQPGDSMKQSAFAGGVVELSAKPVFILVGETMPTPPPVDPPKPKALFLVIHVYDDKTVSTAKAVNKKKKLITDVKVYSDGSIEK